MTLNSHLLRRRFVDFNRRSGRLYILSLIGRFRVVKKQAEVGFWDRFNLVLR